LPVNERAAAKTNGPALVPMTMKVVSEPRIAP